MAERRVAIVGTAPSYTKTPWNDPGLEVWSLNDAYQLKGWQRADRWYDLHPLDKFYHPPNGGPAYAHLVPAGHYVRPEKHVEWLSKLSIPLYLQADPPEGWAHARKFPRVEVQARWGDFQMSTPVWMLLHAMLEGVTEIHVYGIHLATEWEYLKQSPNMHTFLGAFLGPDKWTIAVNDGMRRYESGGRVLVIPVESPMMQGDHSYAYEPKPGPNLEPLKWELHKVKVKQNRIVDQLRRRPWWQPVGKLQEDLWWLKAKEFDLHQQANRLSVGGR